MQKIREKYPCYMIVQLGIEGNTCLKDVDLSLVGKCSFQEALVTLKFATTLVSGDVGPVHFRHFVCGKSSVVLFGPTSEVFLGYTENINIRSTECPGCEFLHSEWDVRCLRTGCCVSQCMSDITVESVFAAVETVIGNNSSTECVCS